MFEAGIGTDRVATRRHDLSGSFRRSPVASIVAAEG